MVDVCNGENCYGTKSLAVIAKKNIAKKPIIAVLGAIVNL